MLSLVDAVAWPAGWLVAISTVPRPGLVGLVIAALLTLCALLRSNRALFRNERYRFTTWRWGLPVIGLLALGALVKALG